MLPESSGYNLTSSAGIYDRRIQIDIAIVAASTALQSVGHVQLRQVAKRDMQDTFNMPWQCWLVFVGITEVRQVEHILMVDFDVIVFK